MKTDLTSFEEAAKLVNKGDALTVGGASFHRAPIAWLREIARQEIKDLVIIVRESALDFLIGAGCVDQVRAALLSFELLGLAPNFCKKSQLGELVHNEGACHPFRTHLCSKIHNTFDGICFTVFRTFSVSCHQVVS